MSADTIARLDNSRIIARAVTDLPDPDSPTSAMVWPLVRREGHIPHRLDLAAVHLEGDADLLGVDHQVIGHRSRTSIGVNGIAQAVTQRVEGEDGDQHESRPATGSRDRSRSPRTCRQSCSIRPQEISGGFTAKPRNPRKLSSRMIAGMPSVTDDDDMAHHVGQDVPRDDPPIAGPHGHRRAHIVDARHRHGLGAHLAATAAPSQGPTITRITKDRNTGEGAVAGISVVSARYKGSCGKARMISTKRWNHRSNRPPI